MTHYSVEISDVANEEANKIYLWRSANLSPEAALHWYNTFQATAQTLIFMPHRGKIVQAKTAQTSEKRRLLYRDGNTVYRIVYQIVEPEPGDSQGIVRVLRVLHGAQLWEAGTEE